VDDLRGEPRVQTECITDGDMARFHGTMIRR